MYAMRSLISLSLLAIFLPGCAGQSLETGGVQSVAAVPSTGASARSAAAAGITPARIYDQIAFLASDEMRGRDTPSPELERAADYIANEFRDFGLRPGGENGGYEQVYALQRRGLSTESVQLNLIGSGGAMKLVHGTDFAAYAGVPNEVRGGVALVAGAIDPAMAELSGQVVLSRLPGPGMTRDFYRAMIQQRTAAQEAGAAGVIFIVDADFPARALAATAEQDNGPRGLSVGEARDIPAFLLSHAAAERAAREFGVDLTQVMQQKGAGAGVVLPVSTAGITAEVSAPVKIFDDFRAPNVIGILPGSDPVLRDTYVVFSAHFDHVGVGRPDATGDSIYNGADDNASGTAGLIEVARAFASLPEAPARSLIFLAVSGEEKGLLGSEYYSDNPTVPLESIVANINVDMIGRNAPDSIVVIGQEYSSLGPLVQEVAAAHPELKMTVAQDIWPEQRFFFRSDHYNFARKEIPALFFFAGVHEDYHRPSDHVEKIDTDKTARVARLIFHTAYEIASRSTAPAWTEQGLREIRALTAGGR
jgi:hypothetical protein